MSERVDWAPLEESVRAVLAEWRERGRTEFKATTLYRRLPSMAGVRVLGVLDRLEATGEVRRRRGRDGRAVRTREYVLPREGVA